MEKKERKDLLVLKNQFYSGRKKFINFVSRGSIDQGTYTVAVEKIEFGICKIPARNRISHPQF